MAGDMLGVDEFNNPKTYLMLLAELLGTFFLVFFGCGAAIFPHQIEEILQVSLAFGLTLICLVHGFGPVSGCHVNPAITLSFLVLQKIPILRSICYILMQLVGASVAVFILDAMTPSNVKGGLTVVSSILSPWQGMVLELSGAFILTYAVHSASGDGRGGGAVVIGLTLVGCEMFLFNFTGASMNPARSFGPALVYSHFTDHWVYWLGPILGAIIAAFVHKIMSSAEGGAGGNKDEESA